MDEHEKAHMVMDDDGAGSAITSVPAGQSLACAANGTVGGRSYHYSSAHNGYVFDDETRGFPLTGGDSDPTADELSAVRRESWNPLPADQGSEREQIRGALSRRYGPAVPVTRAMIDAVVTARPGERS